MTSLSPNVGGHQQPLKRSRLQPELLREGRRPTFSILKTDHLVVSARVIGFWDFSVCL